LIPKLAPEALRILTNIGIGTPVTGLLVASFAGLMPITHCP
jgi:hypothetical protein